MKRRAGDDGSAAVDFALVGGLLTLVFMSVVQLGLLLHVRSTLIDCTAEAARAGALAGHSASDSPMRLRQLLAAELGAGYASRVRVTGAERTTVGDVEVVTLTVSAPAPVVGLAGPTHGLVVTAHAVAEPR
ncbi:TadE family protein [Angustibacter sp. Root456]|uniref:TadE family protein n=1 Tax=Angustibacter sp. Root456 TaxID=1736539 RepID=UPI0006F861E2|nr:TadE family protein [Angustibacter sp. Root456]KQX65655.1 pilus assembly protein TadE [Angustibacter sp. Root456]